MPRPQENYPYSEEAEKSLLSAMLNSPKAAAYAIENVVEENFFRSGHRVVYEAMRGLYEQGVAIDVATLVDQLKARGKLDDAGGMIFVADLLTYSSPANVESYAKIVHDKYTLRRLLRAASEIENAVYSSGAVDAKAVLEIAESEVFNVSANLVKASTVDLHTSIKEAFDELETRISSGSQIPGVQTGFTYLDRMTAGFKPGQLIIVAGRPGMGKTSFALNAALNAAMMHNVGTVLFSLEMSSEELTERMLSSESGVDSQKLRIGNLNLDAQGKLSEAAGRMNDAPVFINDTASMTPIEMRGTLLRLMIESEAKIGLVIVDYLQLMTSGDVRLSGNRVQDVTKISRDLKVLARDLKVPIMALSQLNRGVESRDDKRPQLSDLRESGAIEQDADVVMFIHREELYTGPYDRKGRDVRGKAEVIVGKQRNGPTGKVTLKFEAEHTKFCNTWEGLDEQDEEEVDNGSLPFD